MKGQKDCSKLSEMKEKTKYHSKTDPRFLNLDQKNKEIGSQMVQQKEKHNCDVYMYLWKT